MKEWKVPAYFKTNCLREVLCSLLYEARQSQLDGLALLHHRFSPYRLGLGSLLHKNGSGRTQKEFKGGARDFFCEHLELPAHSFSVSVSSPPLSPPLSLDLEEEPLWKMFQVRDRDFLFVLAGQQRRSWQDMGKMVF